jgi:hypothetical protein
METFWREAAVFCFAMMLARVAVNPLDFTMFLA